MQRVSTTQTHCRRSCSRAVPVTTVAVYHICIPCWYQSLVLLSAIAAQFFPPLYRL